jgi:hypothetical protein
MKKIIKISLNLLAVGAVALSLSGCTAMQETMASQIEVPTLEKQVNRVAIGMTIVRENNIMAFKMPISADAKWPSLVATDLDSKQKQLIDSKIMNDPYFSTYKYTDSIQRKALGSGALMSMLGDTGNTAAKMLDQKVPPIAYRAIQKIEIFYGKDASKWPNVFDFDDSLDNFLDFKNAKMQEIDSPTGDVYNTLDEAMISLIPINLQKDLDKARLEMLGSFKNTAELKREKGQIETALKVDKIKVKEKVTDYTPMTKAKKFDNRTQVTLLETKIKEAESLANEKELIYFELIDEAVVALESEINLNDENYVKLAKNLNIAAEEIQVSAVEAGTSFGLALSNILANNVVLKFPTEIQSLKQANQQIPKNLKANYAKRIKRLLKNAIYLLPNVAIGSYYAAKQASVAGKYKDVTEVILTAYETKLEQEKKAAEEAEKIANNIVSK